MVFSCRVKACLRRPDFSRIFVHNLMKKNPSRPAETLSEGMIPVVRLSFIMIILNMMERMKLTTNTRNLSCSFHGG
ncbi:hypothetical protein MA16_Dca011036 [Dendrobium catenatum]|uniref:Uncharacterized protein n=1 Tax=Dendrobium catenatum TaxID=906689 RepID=A0A2I0WCE1_9ASPA|nr:hypothetical protein MA16_Dca011036 [Dendrobium catenatum]